jgi:hypothetical protein
MFPGYVYPFYRSPYTFMPSPWSVPYGYGNYGNYSSSNIIGSAVANQNMNTIGIGAIGGTQIATPTVVW